MNSLPLRGKVCSSASAPGGVSRAVDIRVRAERLDQFAFGQRVFGDAAPADMPDVLVAIRAFRRYRMLMVTLERSGGVDAPRQQPLLRVRA